VVAARAGQRLLPGMIYLNRLRRAKCRSSSICVRADTDGGSESPASIALAYPFDGGYMKRGRDLSELFAWSCVSHFPIWFSMVARAATSASSRSDISLTAKVTTAAGASLVTVSCS
jgi:hypothetical protein